MTLQIKEHVSDDRCRGCLLDVRQPELRQRLNNPRLRQLRQRYRLVTTLLDHHRFPAEDLIDLYHERWEIESAYLALRHTLLDGHVLRSGDRPGLEQEIWALLTLYQLLRMAMVTAVETRPGINPDRASFTTAREAAREELTAARGICPGGPADLPGVIGRAVLASLLAWRLARDRPNTFSMSVNDYGFELVSAEDFDLSQVTGQQVFSTADLLHFLCGPIASGPVPSAQTAPAAFATP